MKISRNFYPDEKEFYETDKNLQSAHISACDSDGHSRAVA